MLNGKRLINQKVMENHIKIAFKDNPYLMGQMLRWIRSQPKVDAVEVVHGQWLDGYAVDHNGKEVYKSIDCSVCNDIFKVETEDREYWKNRFKVCPFCGAIMDGGNEDE